MKVKVIRALSSGLCARVAVKQRLALFVLVGAEIAVGGVHAVRIVEGLDVAKQTQPGDASGRENVTVDEFGFDRADRRFAGGVVMGSPRERMIGVIPSAASVLPMCTLVYWVDSTGRRTAGLLE